MAPSYVRERCRRSFVERVNTLEAIADRAGYECSECGHREGGAAEDRDVIRAIDTLGKYGLMTGRLDVEEVRVRLARTLQKVEELADPETAERILKALEPIWNPTSD